MAKKEVKDIEPESFGTQLLNWMKKMTAIVASVTAFFTIVGYILASIYHTEIETFWGTVEYIEQEQNVFHPELDTTLNDHEGRILKMEKAWYNKENSFAVGIRTDSYTGELVYKHIDGEQYRMHVYNDYEKVFFTNMDGYLQEIFTFTKAEIRNN